MVIELTCSGVGAVISWGEDFSVTSSPIAVELSPLDSVTLFVSCDEATKQ